MTKLSVSPELRRILFVATVAFLVSRILFFALTIAGSQLVFARRLPGEVWETRIHLRGDRLRPELERILFVGDAVSYRWIALDGYVDAPPGSTPTYPFFPLYPLLVRAFAVTGEPIVDGTLLSNGCFLAALALLGLVARRSGLAPEDAERAMVYLAFFPTSYFCSMPLPESLFLALSLGSILAALHGRWGMAGVIGGAAALTRVQGLLLVVPLGMLFMMSRDRQRWNAAWLCCVPLGTATFMAYLYRLTGDALKFVTIQRQWGRKPTNFLEPLLDYVMMPEAVVESWNPRALNFAFAMLLLVCAIVLLARKQWAYGSYALLSTLLPLSSGSLMGLGRYTVVVFPLYLWLAVGGRAAIVDRIILGLSVTLYGWMIAFMIMRADFALT
jgi:hypothetical protein